MACARVGQNKHPFESVTTTHNRPFSRICITLFTGNGAILGKEDVFVAARKFLEAASKQLLYGLVETTQADIICGVPAVEER